MLFEFEALKDKPLGIVGLLVESSGNFPVTLEFTTKHPMVSALFIHAAYSVSPEMFGRQTSQVKCFSLPGLLATKPVRQELLITQGVQAQKPVQSGSIVALQMRTKSSSTLAVTTAFIQKVVRFSKQHYKH